MIDFYFVIKYRKINSSYCCVVLLFFLGFPCDEKMNSGNRSGQQPQNNVFGFRKTTMMLTLLNVLVAMLILFASTSTDAAACKKADLTPKINPDTCRPQLKMKKPACDKLIAKCRCQHNIMMKWVAGGGCPKNTPAGASVS